VFVYTEIRGLLARPSAPPEKLRIVLALTPDTALLQIAAAKGYFAEEGLSVALAPVSHGRVALDLLARGEADLALAADVPFVISVLKGEHLGIAATVISAANEMAVIARGDRDIAAPHDLLGKRFGVTFVCVRRSHLDGRRKVGGSPQEAGDQRCGSNSSMRPAGCVGSRSSTSFKYA
jgi:ABC-type taurine transport system substrate-binding protein